MPNVTIDGQLAKLVARLSELRIATPVDDPDYETIRKQYQEASDRLAEALDKAIDEADTDYQAFAKGAEEAIQAINEALGNIKKVAKAVVLVAKVLNVVGKVVGKLVA